MSAYRADYFSDSPFFSSIEPYAAPLQWSNWPEPERYWNELNQLGAPITFVADSGTVDYELQIAQSKQVPTRYANWHDYFNALCWCAFPCSKSVFNQLHKMHWQHQQRTRPRDGLTLLDESGAIVCSDDEATLQRLRAMDWPSLFVEHRAHTEQHLRVWLIGHGLMEKCLQPYIGITAHAYCLLVDSDTFNQPDKALLSQCDRLLAEQLGAKESLSPAELCPLPILGIPNWWPDNNDLTFYDNVDYFRRSRRRQPQSSGK